MSGDGQRWRVLLAEGGRSFRIEVDTGAGFRLATVVEVDQALKLTTYQVAERSAERNRNAEHPARFSERTSSMRRCVPFTSAYITPASATPTVIPVPMIDAVSGFMLSSLCRVLMPWSAARRYHREGCSARRALPALEVVGLGTAQRS